jgi:uncharacterized protein YqcC (DUF446 family)
MRVSEISVLLSKLTLVLQRHGVWEMVAPETEALNSQMPFASDCLSCTQWLQWIFLPRITAWSAQPIPLPFVCVISPYIEMCKLPTELSADLLSILWLIEQCINLDLMTDRDEVSQ